MKGLLNVTEDQQIPIKVLDWVEKGNQRNGIVVGITNLYNSPYNMK